MGSLGWHSTQLFTCDHVKQVSFMCWTSEIEGAARHRSHPTTAKAAWSVSNNGHLPHEHIASASLPIDQEFGLRSGVTTAVGIVDIHLFWWIGYGISLDWPIGWKEYKFKVFSGVFSVFLLHYLTTVISQMAVEHFNAARRKRELK